jgi:membrane-bound lytic murein transglycosylase A
MWRRIAAAAFLAVVIAGLALWWTLRPKPPPPDRLVLEQVTFSALPGWLEGRQGAALIAFKRSCGRLLTLPADRGLGAGGRAGVVADWRPSCEAAAQLPDDDDAARGFFQAWFAPLAVRNNARAEGLFTGYFEAQLRGSLSPGGAYTVPLHGRPDDLVSVDLGLFRDDLKGRRIAGRVADGRLRPFESRGEIAAGALAGKAPVLAWVDDPIAAFFLHIQGSGRILLAEGGELRVGFAAQNGHPYVAIGRELIRRGAIARERVSLQTIRAWLRANPDQADAVMAVNASYVFFRRLEGEGPVGAQGAVLTPGRSLAIDRRYLPLGAPLWLEASAPAPEPGAPDRPLRRLMVAQDTGGAIRGPVRGDVFWGHGPEAEAVAGRMKHQGRYFLLLPRTLVAKRAEP